jgi:hypothetical protein
MDEREIFETYTSPLSGKTVRLVPIAYYKTQSLIEKVEKEFLAAGKPIKPPTYTVPVGKDGKDTQVHEHTESTLVTDEDRAAWKAHKQAVAELNAETNLRTLKFTLRNGALIDMDADTSDWEAEQEFDGIDVPASRREKYLHYLLTEVLTSRFEQREVASRIMELSILGSMGDNDTAEAVKKFFRRATNPKLEAEREG